MAKSSTSNLIKALERQLDYGKKFKFKDKVGSIVCISRIDAESILTYLKKKPVKSTEIQVLNLPNDWVDVELDGENSFGMSDYEDTERFRIKP